MESQIINLTYLVLNPQERAGIWITAVCLRGCDRRDPVMQKRCGVLISLGLYSYMDSFLNSNLADTPLRRTTACVVQAWTRTSRGKDQGGPILQSLMEDTQWSSFIRGFAFQAFNYLPSTSVQKYEMKNSRNKQLINFKLFTVLSSMMNFCHSSLSWPGHESSFCPAHPCCLCFLHVSHLVLQCLCLSNPYFT